MFIPENSWEKQGYRPQNPAYRIKGDPLTRYTYVEGRRETDFLRLGEVFPELILVIKSIDAFGLMPCCPEMMIWIDFYNRIRGADGLDYNPLYVKRINESIASADDAKERFQRLYFTLVLPVAAAVDTGYTDIACGIYTAVMESLEDACRNTK